MGDNDNLSALVANLMEADLLIMLTDQPGLFTEDPRRNHDASLITQLKRVDEEAMALAGGVGTSLGTGGMRTKLQAARLASLSGVTSIIAEGREADVLRRILDGETLGTRIEAATNGLESRKRWLVTEKSRGRLHVDAGAARKLQTGGASLLPVGVTRVEGKFERGAHVMIIGPDDKEIAQGLSSYSSKAIQQLCGVHSDRISEILGYSYGDAVVHRNNMVLLT